MTTSRHGEFTLDRRLVRHARWSCFCIAETFLVGLLATPLALSTPLPSRIAIDRAILEKEVRLISFRDLAATATDSSLAEGARR